MRRREMVTLLIGLAVIPSVAVALLGYYITRPQGLTAEHLEFLGGITAVSLGVTLTYFISTTKRLTGYARLRTALILSPGCSLISFGIAGLLLSQGVEGWWPYFALLGGVSILGKLTVFPWKRSLRLLRKG